jgi:hypothetical protein
MLMGGFHLFRLPADTPFERISSESLDFVTPLGYTSREKEVPVCPLQIDDIPVAILEILSPTEGELQDRGKSDWLTKLIVLVQTMWFIIQCIARWVQHLPLTELEVVTLAYTMLNFFIYAFWWYKPQNVGCPIRVYKTSTAVHKKGGKQVYEWEAGISGFLERPAIYFIGSQDHFVDYSQERSLPMFWSDNQDLTGTTNFLASLFMSLLAAGFGGMHFLAWYSPFPSRFELILWQVACVGLTASPLIPWIGILVGGALELSKLPFILILASLIPLPPLYVAGRAATLVMAFTTLRSVPDAALIDIDWTTFFPHI